MYNDRDLLAKTLEAEAGNQGLGGMMAVGSVIANRMKQGGSLRDVILAPAQFSAWNKVTGAAGGEQGQNMEAIKPSKDAYAAADAILSGNFVDVTGGATHYYNPSISQPKWGKEKAGGDWLKIGGHLFGKADGFRTGAATMDGQQPTAQQMQQMQQQPRGLMGFLSDPRTRQVLASMDVSGLFSGVAEQAGRDIVRQEEQAQRNRTADWLSTQPDGAIFAEAIRSGVPAAQAYDAYQKSKTGDYVVVGKTLVDRRTGKVVFQAPTTASMTRFNPATGQYETISGLDPSQLDLKESESASTIYSGRMRQAENILNLVEREGTDFAQRIAQNIPFVGNYLTTPEYKSYDQAKRNFINAVLRKESGAAIAESEFENADKQYFPQPGDTAEIIAQKRANRELAIRLMEASAGEGAAYANQQLQILQNQITGGETQTSQPSSTKNTIVD